MNKILFNEDWTYEVSSMELLGAMATEVYPVTLPHDATIHEYRDADDPGRGSKGFWPSKNYDYKKTFFVPEEDRGKTIQLQFEGVYRECKVYVNGQYIGGHVNGYTEFIVDVTHYVKYGQQNDLKVSVRSGKDSRWYAGAGIYRNVNLFVGGSVYIPVDGVRLTTKACDETVASVMAQVAVKCSDLNVHTLNVTVEMTDADGHVVCADTQKMTVCGQEEKTATARLYIANPKLWNVDAPNLYKVTATISENGQISDTCVVPGFGIRVLSLDNVRGLAINGKTVKLYGGCIHHDNGVIGCATIPSAEDRRVRLLKESGYNAIRMAHHPMSRALLDACDKYGVAVMDELTDMWNAPKNEDDYSVHFAQCWRDDLARMVQKDYNHPCVVMYSCGNEIIEVGCPAGAEMMRQISQEFHRLDDTRFTTAGTNNLLACMDVIRQVMGEHQDDQNSAVGTEINETMADMGTRMKMAQMMPQIIDAVNESYEVLDIAGYNYAEGRYAIDRERFSNWMSVGSETFPKDLAGNWKLCMENPDVIGDFSWTSWDYLGEAGIGKYTFRHKKQGDSVYGGYPFRLAFDADFDITGEKTPQGYYREIVVGHRKAPYIAVQEPGLYDRAPRIASWSWSSHVSSWTWKGYEGKPIRVEVYSAADEVELLINGVSAGRQQVRKETQSDLELAFFTVFETVYTPGCVEAVAYVGGAETGRYMIQTASEDVHISMEADKIAVSNDGTDLVFIDIYLKDADGIINADANRKVSVAVSGCGCLQGFGSGAPDSEENFFDSEAVTFNGHLLAVVRPTGIGEIQVSAQAEGCAPVQIVLKGE